MLRRIKIKIQLENGEKPSVYWGYILYGILMRNVGGKFAEYMHGQGLKPVSQYVVKEDEKAAAWTINFLDEASFEIVAGFLENCRELYSENKESLFLLTDKEFSEPLSSIDFCGKFFAGPKPARRVEMIFKTPCSFKSEEQYCIFPTAELIIKSLVNKWNAFSDYFTLDDENALKHLIEGTRISRYVLKSTSYHLKGTTIPSFAGRLTLTADGPEPLARLFNLVAAFAEYSGVGMKTALGMGGCEVKLERKQL